MKKGVSVLGLAILFLVLTAVFCSTIEAAEVQGITKDQITIGAYMAYSGPGGGGLSYSTAAGANAYFNTINEQGGINGRKIKWITEDDGYQPSKTIAAVKKLVEKDNIFAIVAPFGAPTTLAVLPYLEEQKVPCIGPWSPVIWTEVPFRRNVFMISPADAIQHYFMADYFIKQGAKRIAMIYQAGVGKAPLDAVSYRLKESGLSLVDSAEFTPGQEDFSAIISRFKAANPELVLTAALSVPVSLIVREARKQGLKPKFGFANHGTIIDPEFLRLAGTAGEGTGTIQHFKDAESKDPEVAEFRARLKKYYPKEVPGLLSMHGYVSAKIFCEGMKKAGPEPTYDKLISAIESMTGTNIGFCAPLGYSATDHQGITAIRFNRVEKGKWVPITDWLPLPKGMPWLKK
jgi:branched-chain amino acid transport system substrate-binding protein